MIALRAALVVLVIVSLVASWMTARYDGAWLIGLVAAIALVMTFAWGSVPARDHAGGVPDMAPGPGPRWEKVLAFVVCPVLLVIAVGILVHGVTA